jgi:hypothetical protein
MYIPSLCTTSIPSLLFEVVITSGAEWAGFGLDDLDDEGESTVVDGGLNSITLRREEWTAATLGGG